MSDNDSCGECIVAIHQPNFFPWLGFFDKIARSSVFVLLDNVQFPKTGGTWINRVQWLVGGKGVWVTAPIVRAYHGVRPIREMLLNNTTSWRDKLVKTLEVNYRRAPSYKAVAPMLIPLINNPTDNLAEYNIAAIRAISTGVGLDASKFVFGSMLRAEGTATDLLINIVNAVGGTAYLAGGGAAAYQEDQKFATSDLELVYQGFVHPVYPQFNSTEFIPGLSIIDALMNCGFEGTRMLIEGDRTTV